jgi:methylenetetrahydrofolate dehydrogenase (NADP+)/methenyltetrahydrofolate cyclohydrolase/formyltetrahydrofolate synthetase
LASEKSADPANVDGADNAEEKPLDIALESAESYASACTPFGCMDIIKSSGMEISGKHAVVIGQLNVVAAPVALMLKHANATVMVCHSRSENIPEEVKRADIVISALGRNSFVQSEWLKPGAVVMDVQIDDSTAKTDMYFPEDCEYQHDMLTARLAFAK